LPYNKRHRRTSDKYIGKISSKGLLVKGFVEGKLARRVKMFERSPSHDRLHNLLDKPWPS
jgi:hypothetical protein